MDGIRPGPVLHQQTWDKACGFEAQYLLLPETGSLASGFSKYVEFSSVFFGGTFSHVLY